MRAGVIAAVSLALTTLVNVAPASPEARKALLFDMRKLVSAQEDTGWTIDRYEIEDLMADALVSVCQAEEEVRSEALALAEQRVQREGGPLKDAIAGGKDPADLGGLITAERVRDLLREALERAPEDCPVWMSVDADFRGIQTDARRITISVEGGGLFIGQRSSNGNEIGAGGAGRLLLGYGINHHYTLMMGIDFGGAALFQREEDTTNFPLQFTFAVPIVLRHIFNTFHHDLEVGPAIYFTEDDTRPSYGVRTGGVLGVSTFRIRNIMPWAGVGLAFEHYFANDYRNSVGVVKGGARVGFDWDF